VAGLWFEHQNIHWNTWYSNDGHTCKKIDHILVTSRWKAVHNCHVYCSLELNTDHRPVVATFAIRLSRSLPKKPAPHPRYNARVLSDLALKLQNTVEIRHRFSALFEGESEDWHTFKVAANDVSAICIGTVSRNKNREWISNKNWDLIDKKRENRHLVDLMNTRNLVKSARHTSEPIVRIGQTKKPKRERSQGCLREFYALFCSLQPHPGCRGHSHQAM